MTDDLEATFIAAVVSAATYAFFADVGGQGEATITKTSDDPIAHVITGPGSKRLSEIVAAYYLRQPQPLQPTTPIRQEPHS